MHIVLFQSCFNDIRCNCENCAYADDYFMGLQTEIQFGMVYDCWFLAQSTDAPVVTNININGDYGTQLSFQNGLEGRTLNLNLLCGQVCVHTSHILYIYVYT